MARTYPTVMDALTPDFNRLNPRSNIPRVIGLTGYARSGKDTVGAMLVDLYGYQRKAFADTLRDALYRLNPLIVNTSTGDWEELQSLVDDVGWERAKSYLSNSYDGPRALLQRLGTEVGREMFGENFWVDQTMKTVDASPQRFVITDVRFPNEGRAVIDRGGWVVRVERPGVEATNTHASETAMDDWQYDHVIENDGSLTDLQARVMELLGDI